MAEPRRRITYNGTGIARDIPLKVLREDHVRRAEPDQPTPAEIVAELHRKIAAKSPRHAALVARFERKQAAKNGTS